MLIKAPFWGDEPTILMVTPHPVQENIYVVYGYVDSKGEEIFFRDDNEEAYIGFYNLVDRNEVVEVLEA